VKTLVIGHRGARSLYPENTLAGFNHCIENKTNSIELDVVASKDNEIIINHDPFLNPKIHFFMNNQRIKKKQTIYKSLTYKDLKKFKIGVKPHTSFKKQIPCQSEYILSLTDFCRWMENHKLTYAKKIKLNIEIKYNYKTPELFPEISIYNKIIDKILKKFDLCKRVTIQSFNYKVLNNFKKINSKVKTGFLTEKIRPSLFEQAKNVQCDIFMPYYSLLTASNIKKIRILGKKIIPWTVNNPRSWKKLIALNVDGIITDNPQKLIEFLNPKS